jgi:hypothetical protein
MFDRYGEKERETGESNMATNFVNLSREVECKGEACSMRNKFIIHITL